MNMENKVVWLKVGSAISERLAGSSYI